MSQQTQSNVIRLAQPAAGQTVSIPVNQDNMRMALGFEPDPNAVAKNGQDLEFSFEDGGKIVLQGYYDHFTSKTLPVMVTESGDELPGEDFLASLNEDLLTAAGPGAGGATGGSGAGEYADDPGALLDGIARLGSLGTIYWDRNTEVPEEYNGLLEQPGGAGSFTVVTDVNGSIQVGVYEDARPNQHLDGQNSPHHYGQMLFTFDGSGTTVCDFVNMSGFDVGTILYLGNPGQEPMIEITSPDQVVRIPADQFDNANGGVWIEPPANSDNDMSISTSLEIRVPGNGLTDTVDGPTFTVIVDAVADKPEDVASDVTTADGNIHYSGPSAVTKVTDHETKDGFISDTMRETADERAGVSVSIPLKVSATFGDYGENDATDVGEQHYILIQRPAAAADGTEWTCVVNGITYGENDIIRLKVDADGKPLEDQNDPNGLAAGEADFFRIPVDNADLQQTNGVATVDAVLQNDNYVGGMTQDQNDQDNQTGTADDKLSIWTGGMADEGEGSDRELDTDNNQSYTFDPSGPHELDVDIIDASLTVKAGWMYEDGDGASYMRDPSAGHTVPGDIAAGTNDDGASAPIIISIAGGDGAEYISKVSLTYDGDGGTLEYNGTSIPSGTVFTLDSNTGNYVSGDGSITLPPSALGDGSLRFVPDVAHSADEVSVDYEVTVVDGDSGASAEFSGSTVVIVDAVADLGVFKQIGDPDADLIKGSGDGDGLVYGSGKQLAADYDGDNHAAARGETVAIKGNITFPDQDGSETHYIVANIPAGWRVPGCDLVSKGDIVDHLEDVVGDRAAAESVYLTNDTSEPYMLLELQPQDMTQTGTSEYTMANGVFVEAVTDSATGMVTYTFYDTKGGTPFAEAQLDTATGETKFSFDVQAPSGVDNSGTVYVKGISVENDPGGQAYEHEHDYSNNVATTEAVSVPVTMDAATSGLKISTTPVFEGDNWNKHTGDTALEGGGKISITRQDGPDAANKNAEAVNAMVLQYDDSHGSIYVGGVKIPNGSVLDFEWTRDANGDIRYTGVVVYDADGNQIASFDSNPASGQLFDNFLNNTVGVSYKPDSPDYSDTDVTLDIVAAIEAPDSGDVKILATDPDYESGLSDAAKDALGYESDGSGGYKQTDKMTEVTTESVGDNVILVDAVADKPIFDASDNEVIYAEKGDNSGDHYAKARPGDEVTLKGKISFPDWEDGSETHTILVQADNGHGTVTSITINGVEYDPSTLTLNAQGYYEIPVNTGATRQGDFEVELKVEVADDPTTNAKDGTYDIKVIAKAEETGTPDSGGELPITGPGSYDNNVSETPGSIAYEVAPAQGEVKFVAGQVYEGDKPNQHAGDGIGTVADNTKGMQISLVNGDNEYIAKVYLEYDSKGQGAVMVNGCIIPSGTILTAVLDAQGNVTGYTCTGKNAWGEDVPVTLTPGQLADGSIRYVPNPDSDSDADVPIGIAASVVDPDSGDVSVSTNIPDWGKTPETSGPAGQLVGQHDDNSLADPKGLATGSSDTVIVDAVADRPVDLEVPKEAAYPDRTDAPGTPKDAAAPGDTVTIAVKVGFTDYRDSSERQYIVIERPGNGWKCDESEGLLRPGTSGDAGKTYFRIDVTEIIDELVAKIGPYPTPGGTYQHTDSATGITVTITIKADGTWGPAEVSTDVHLQVPETGITADSTVKVNVGGVTVEQEGLNETNPIDNNNRPNFTGDKDSEITTDNNVAVNVEPVDVKVGVVETKIVIGIENNRIYENLTPDADQGVYDKSDPATITLGGMAKGETAHVRLVFSGDFSDDAAATMTVSYTSPDGTTQELHLTADGNGGWYVEFPSVALGPNGETPAFVFNPGDNYSADDIKVDYTVKVTDDESGSSKVWTTDPNYSNNPGDAGYDESVCEIVGSDKNDTPYINVDAVAQKPEFIDKPVAVGRETNGDPGAKDEDGDGRYDYIKPGDKVTVTTTVRFQDFEDGSEEHYLYLEWNPDIALAHGETGCITYTGSDGQQHEIPIPQPPTFQPDGEKVYIKVPVSNDVLQDCDGDLELSVTYQTSSNASDGSVTIRADAHDAEERINGSPEQEQGIRNDNNLASDSADAEFKFAKAGGISFGAAKNLYEDDMAHANTEDFSRNWGTAINFANGLDAADTLNELTFTYDQARGDILLITDPNYPSDEAGLDAYWSDIRDNMPDRSGFNSDADWQNAVNDYLGRKGIQVIDSGTGLTSSQIDALVNGGGNLHYMPKSSDGSYGTGYESSNMTDDSDLNFGYTYKVTNNNSGDVNSGTGSEGIIVDAVAQMPEIEVDWNGVVVSNNVYTIPVDKLVFHDDTGPGGSSENHFVLVKYIPGAKVDGAESDLFSVMNPDGSITQYFKIPASYFEDHDEIRVDLSGAHISSNTVLGPGETPPDSGHTIEIKAVAQEKVAEGDGGELTYGNNTAVAEAGGMDVPGSGHHHHGGHPHIVTTPAFEDGTPNANTGDYTQDGDGKISICPPGSASEVDELELTYDPSQGTLVDGNGIPVVIDNPSGWPNGWSIAEDGSGNWVVTIKNPQGDDFNFRPGNFEQGNNDDIIGGNYDPSAHHNHDDADVKFGWEMKGSDSNGGWQNGSGSGGETLVVDAVAQQPGSTGDVGNYDDAIGRGEHGGNTTVTVKVPVSFPDTDESESHYLLVEKQPGINIGDPGQYELVQLGDTTYYKIPVDDADLDADGNGEVSVVISVNQDHMQHNADEDKRDGTEDGRPIETNDPNNPVVADGSDIYKLKTGSMTEENRPHDGQEVTGDNNVGAKIDGSLEFKVSFVETTIAASATDTFENGNNPVYDGQGEYVGMGTGHASTVSFNVDPDANDTVESFTLEYDGTQGTLTWPDGSEIKTDASRGITVEVDGAGKVTITFDLDGNASLNDVNGGFKYTSNGHSSTDGAIKWSVEVSDPLSGEHVSQSGTVVVKVDAVAQLPVLDKGATEVSYADGAEAAQSGAAASVDVHLTFDDDGSNGEVHYAVFERGADWACSTATITGVDGVPHEVDVILVYGKDGTQYYAVEIPSGDNYTNVDVSFKVTMPSVDEDWTSGETVKVGGIATESYIQPDEEVDLGNNWAETTVDVELRVGVVETDVDQIAATGAGRENEPCELEFTGVDHTAAGHNERLEITITEAGLKGGSLYEWDASANGGAGGWVELSPMDGKYVLSVDGSNRYAYQAPDHASGQFDLDYTGKVVDNASGAEKDLPAGQITVGVYGVGTDGTVDAVSDPEAADWTEVAGHTAAVSLPITGSFDDNDGSEAHYFLVAVPDGMTVNGGVAVDPDDYPGCPLGSQNGYTVYKLTEDEAKALEIGNIKEGDFAGGNDIDIKVVAVAEETRDVDPNDPDSAFGYSPVTDVAIDKPSIDFNLDPTAGAPGSDTVNVMRGDEWTGNLIDLGNFTDGDDDTLTVATVTINGVAVPVGAATDIGDGLTATVNADGTCTITGVSGVKPADLDKIEISVTVKDQLGAESNEGSVTLNLTDANAGPQGDAIFANDQIAAALSGTLDGLFTDPEGDTVLLTSVTFGSETKDWDGLGSISIDGEHGTLTVTNTGDATNPNYTYTYEPHDTSAPGDSDSFSFTAKDSFGEESTVDGSLNITLEGIDQNLAQGETADGTAFGWDTGVTVSGEGHNNIVGGAGDDTFTLKGSGSELHAGAGDDVITVSGSGHEVHADSGENVITVSGAGHQIYGGGDADHIDGRNGSGNFLFGGDGDDTIYAGANDTVRGGLGDDVMYSGEGETSFVWDVEDIASGGLDTIMDFSMDDKLVFDDLFSATGTFDLDDGKLVMEVSVDNGNASQTVEVHFSTSDSGYQDFVTAYTDNAGDQQAQEALVAALIKGITGS